MADAATKQLEKLAIDKKEKKKKKKEEEKEEKERKYGNVALAEKRAPGEDGASVNLTTNIKKIDIDRNTPIYKYDVLINLTFTKSDGTDVIYEVSKSRAKGTQHLHNLKKCEMLYKLTVQRNPTIFGRSKFFYDRQASLYSFKKLPKADNGLTYTFTANEMSVDTTPTLRDIKEAKITITQVAQTFQATSEGVSNTVNPAPRLADRTLLEALNTIINSSAVDDHNVVNYRNGLHYFLNAEAADFARRDILHFPNGYKISGIGLKTAVKTLEGTAPSLYAVTEIKKSLFHFDNRNMSLLGKLNRTHMFSENMRDYQLLALTSQIKGLQCYLNCEINRRDINRQIVTIIGFGPAANSESSKFETSDGNMLTVAEHFLRKYNKRLAHPNLPTIAAKGREQQTRIYFPVECLTICEDQIVTTEQMTSDEQREAIKYSAMLPAIRKHQTELASRGMKITGANIEDVVRVADRNEMVMGRILNTPRILFAGNKPTSIHNKSSWNAGRYVEPVSLTKWQIHFIGTDTKFSHKKYNEKLKEIMVKKGIQIAAPQIFIHDGRSGNNNKLVEDILRNASSKGIQFLFFIVRDELNLHQQIKAMEQKYNVLTQEVRETVAYKIIDKQQNMTMENIVNKINMKLGGLNFRVVDNDADNKYSDDPERAFIGFETTQRTSSEGPIMIGYSANVLKNPQKYAGGYYFVEKNKDVFGPVIKRVMQRVIQKISETRGKKPSKLVLFFNGVSEGQWSLINEEYSKHVNEVCKEFGYQPKVTLIAVSKVHNERLYFDVIDATKTRAAEQNITPGTCVDTKIVSPVVNEFYLTAQNAFQGTAKPPKFSLIYDTSNISMDILEKMTYQLCFLHEIVNATVSLPVPLLIADRFAKRAGMVFRKWLERPENREVRQYNYDQLNQELAYDGKALDFTRFNA